MRNTYLLKTDNTIAHTEKNPVIEKSNNVDTIYFISDKEYNGIDLTDMDLIMEYRLPISKKVKVAKLNLVDDNYRELYLKYSVPLTAKLLTSERGNVEMNLSFMGVAFDENGTATQYVRNFVSTYLNIVPLETYTNITDSGMSDLAEMYLANKAMMEGLQQVADSLVATKADDIAMDQNDVYLTAGGTKVGTGIKLKDIDNAINDEGAHVVEFDESEHGPVDSNDVVEF